jgi:hypothetical protein
MIDIIIDMFILMLVCLGFVGAQVSHEPIVPEVVKVKFAQSSRTVPSSTAFRTKFPALGYQIGGAVY